MKSTFFPAYSLLIAGACAFAGLSAAQAHGLPATTIELASTESTEHERVISPYTWILEKAFPRGNMRDCAQWLNEPKHNYNPDGYYVKRYRCMDGNEGFGLYAYIRYGAR